MVELWEVGDCEKSGLLDEQATGVEGSAIEGGDGDSWVGEFFFFRRGMDLGIDTDTAAFTSRTANYVIPASHNQFCQESLPYITTATALLTTAATTFYLLLL
jgi:hypothetical protein